MSFARTSLIPFGVCTRTARATRPLRKSASTIHVMPCCASVTARFTDTVVLPSPVSGETTRSTCGVEAFWRDRRTDTPRPRSASPSGEFGRVIWKSGVSSFVGCNGKRRAERTAAVSGSSAITGTTETDSVPKYLLISSGVRIRVSIVSRTKATSTPPSSPMSKPKAMVRIRCGRVG